MLYGVSMTSLGRRRSPLLDDHGLQVLTLGPLGLDLLDDGFEVGDVLETQLVFLVHAMRAQT